MASKDEGFEPALECRPIEQHSAATGLAAQADIRPQPRHSPVVSATGVGLSKSNNVVNQEFDGLGGH
jgi:hypothetical protein